jgi:hypothetical protein
MCLERSDVILVYPASKKNKQQIDQYSVFLVYTPNLKTIFIGAMERGK